MQHTPARAADAPEPATGLGQWVMHVLKRLFRRPHWRDVKVLVVLAVTTVLCATIALLLLMSAAHAMPLAAGDRIALLVEAGEEFSGKYQLDVQGRIHLPYAGALPLAGLEPDAAGPAVARRLVDSHLFKRSFARATVQVLVWAPLQIHVSGSVFYPGVHRVNLAPSRDRAPEKTEELPGAALPERRLSDALRAAGGVTPWADVAHVAIRREGATRLYDLRGLLTGIPGNDPSLHSGDEILVPEGDTMNVGLARPSAITPPGIKIFVSNLIQPALSNAQATANGGAISLAYGSRFSQAVVAANCVGGIGATAASRAAILLRTDRSSGATRHWEQPVEQLVRNARGDGNPVLQEGDALACYDSDVTALRDVFRTITDILMPFSVLRRKQ